MGWEVSTTSPILGKPQLNFPCCCTDFMENHYCTVLAQQIRFWQGVYYNPCPLYSLLSLPSLYPVSPISSLFSLNRSKNKDICWFAKTVHSLAFCKCVKIKLSVRYDSLWIYCSRLSLPLSCRILLIWDLVIPQHMV